MRKFFELIEPRVELTIHYFVLFIASSIIALSLYAYLKPRFHEMSFLRKTITGLTLLIFATAAGIGALGSYLCAM